MPFKICDLHICIANVSALKNCKKKWTMRKGGKSEKASDVGGANIR